MLRRRPLGRRDRRHRLYALTLTRHHQARAIIAQWTRAMRVPDHAPRSLDIAREPQFNVFRFGDPYPTPYAPMGFASISDPQIPSHVTFC
jgi:hypothetical protein